MTGEADGIAVTVLRDSGIELDGLRHRIAESVRKSPAHAHQELPYTRAAKEALEFAVRAAIERGYASVGTELLLLGILQDAGATAAEVIATSGVTADRITSRVSRLLEITHPV
jgi:ATP-dependent Clp protease ATP-binding subunit ClpA